MSDKERAELEELKSEQSNLMASIRYAKRIQDALLLSRGRLKEIFNDFSILYEPKDIVSGDFYYAKKVRNRKYLVVGDCTGHGVPGGFMSILCNDYTMRAMFHEWEPKNILELIDEYLDEGLNQNEINDGMDASIAMIDHDVKKLYFSAANHYGLLLKSDGSMIELKGTRRAIGKETWRNEKSVFKQIEQSFDTGDVLYMFSDGFRDQFDRNDKKLGKRDFNQLIHSIGDLDMLDQQKALRDAYRSQLQGVEQMDDVLVLGVRL